MKSTIEKIGTEISAFMQNIAGCEDTEFILVPYFDLSQVKKLKIIVTPEAWTTDNTGSATRGCVSTKYKFNIGIFKKVKDDSEISDLLCLVELISKSLERKTIAGFFITSVENDPVYDMNSLRTSKVFVSALTANIKVL